MENSTTLNKIHPCFDKEAKLKYARIHIPVAPQCNVQCGYCNRKYDCVNESRPGVTSSVLKPFQALNYMRAISQKIKNVSTIGIAGPGDAFAEPEKTLESIRLIKNEFPDRIFCLSSNGLNILPYVDEIATLNVTHVTLTINSFRLETLEKIYNWARFNKKMYRGIEAAKLMLSQQGEALKALVAKGIVVKVNTVIIPGVNDTEIEEVAKIVSELGASTMNCIPLIPTEGSDMADFEKPTGEMVRNIVRSIHKYIKPMTHCARCRADAAGMLGKDDTSAFKLIDECAAMPTAIDNTKPHVAVASYEGLMINKHLGEATDFLIYKQTETDYELVEKRKAPAKGEGDLRWINLAKTLNDCSYILVNGVGARPVDLLQKVGIAVVEMSGLIDDGLDAVYKGKKLKAVLKTTLSKCGSSCGGNAMGCG
ncbi:NifB/NifX family molybdenum-iron cluster-binding protein [Mariniflexile sp.]|uniref:NifB/NifX family molybdenum-iron cluster-binding protein n=1 Tax=Mariniflexile sp. TaxID=1979402 RepID=UPI0035629D4C